jgi:hypothetical protein
MHFLGFNRIHLSKNKGTDVWQNHFTLGKFVVFWEGFRAAVARLV